MSLLRALILVPLALVAGCGELAPTGPERGLPTSIAIDETARPPEVTGNVFAFTIDRARRPYRSVAVSGQQWELGNAYMAGFEFRVDPALRASRGGLSVAHIIDAETGRVLYDLEVDGRRGVTFLGRTCQAPEDFGEWQRMTIRTRLAADGTGYLEMRCGIGPLTAQPVVFARSDVPTARGGACLSDPARCDRAAPARAFQWQTGILADSAAAIPGGGATVEIRRMVHRRLYVVFTRTRNL